jgi:hypothetical protein
MCVCIVEFVVVLFKMLSCNALSVVSGTCLFADCWEVPPVLKKKKKKTDYNWRIYVEQDDVVPGTGLDRFRTANSLSLKVIWLLL